MLARRNDAARRRDISYLSLPFPRGMTFCSGTQFIAREPGGLPSPSRFLQSSSVFSSLHSLSVEAEKRPKPLVNVDSRAKYRWDAIRASRIFFSLSHSLSLFLRVVKILRNTSSRARDPPARLLLFANVYRTIFGLLCLGITRILRGANHLGIGAHSIDHARHCVRSSTWSEYLAALASLVTNVLDVVSFRFNRAFCDPSRI